MINKSGDLLLSLRRQEPTQSGGINASDIGGGYNNSNHGLLTNGSLQNVYLNKLMLQDINDVVSIELAQYGITQYGTTDVRTDDDGVLYFYFPTATSTAVTVTTTLAIYGETYDTPSNHTATIRILPMIKATGIENKYIVAEQINVYPNPTNEMLNVRIEKNVSSGTLALYDMNGRILLSQPVNGNFTQIDLSSFVTGTYILLLIENGTVNERVRVIKN